MLQHFLRQQCLDCQEQRCCGSRCCEKYTEADTEQLLCWKLRLMFFHSRPEKDPSYRWYEDTPFMHLNLRRGYWVVKCAFNQFWPTGFIISQHFSQLQEDRNLLTNLLTDIHLLHVCYPGGQLGDNVDTTVLSLSPYLHIICQLTHIVVKLRSSVVNGAHTGKCTSMCLII